MSLSPPPDHSKSLLVVAACFGCSLIAFAANRYIYPVAGDTQHRFPFGGCYRDGTKSAIYYKPNLPISGRFSLGKLEVLLIVLLLIASIVGLSSRRSRRCHVCGRDH